jgi:CRP-like cAMP-binding protein
MSRTISKEAIRRLETIPLFSRCSRKELALAASLGTPIPIRGAKPLMVEGSLGQEFFVMLDGEATCVKSGETVAGFGPGDFFGEIALLRHRNRNASVYPAAVSEVMVYDPREFGALAQLPSVKQMMLDHAAARC